MEQEITREDQKLMIIHTGFSMKEMERARSFCDSEEEFEAMMDEIAEKILTDQENGAPPEGITLSEMDALYPFADDPEDLFFCDDPHDLFYTGPGA